MGWGKQGLGTEPLHGLPSPKMASVWSGPPTAEPKEERKQKADFSTASLELCHLSHAHASGPRAL